MYKKIICQKIRTLKYIGLIALKLSKSHDFYLLLIFPVNFVLMVSQSSSDFCPYPKKSSQLKKIFIKLS